jgi:hypothetical protein
MRRVAISLAIGCLAIAMLPAVVRAQCEGGVTLGGSFLANGGYAPGGCAFTNPTTPGQLYPSGAQPVPSTNPALGGSYLPGQRQPADLIPVNSSDLGPAPSLVNVAPSRLGTQGSGTNVGPGSTALPGQIVVGPSGTTNLGDVSGLPAQLPSSGAPALTGNRANPGGERIPGSVLGTTPPAVVISPAQGQAAVDSVQTPGTTGIGGVRPASLVDTQRNSAGLDAGASQGTEPSPAPGRGPVFISEEVDSIIIVYPGR